MDLYNDVLTHNPIRIYLGEGDNFLRIRETLTRVGLLASDRGIDKTLYQPCFILFSRPNYYICHYKELVALLEGRYVEMDESDFFLRDTIASLIQSWGLCTILNPEDMTQTDITSLSNIKVVKYSEKQDYELYPLYDIYGAIQARSGNQMAFANAA